jgi:hypothetical protein
VYRWFTIALLLAAIPYGTATFLEHGKKSDLSIKKQDFCLSLIYLYIVPYLHETRQRVFAILAFVFAIYSGVLLTKLYLKIEQKRTLFMFDKQTYKTVTI